MIYTRFHFEAWPALLLDSLTNEKMQAKMNILSGEFHAKLELAGLDLGVSEL